MNDIKNINAIISEYSVPVSNNGKILKWLCNNSLKSYKENKKSLLSNISKELINLFGKQLKTIRQEYVMKLWVLQYKDLIFNVYSGKRKGTTIEICNYNYDDIRLGKREDEILEFLNKLYEIINEIN